MKILVINPGSTSTKLALFQDDQKQAEKSIIYTREQLEPYETIYDQLDLRVKDMMSFLQEENCDPKTLDGIAARGGMLPPLKAGAYVVDTRLVHALRYEYAGLHGSNLAGLMAAVLTEQYQIPAWIYDAVSTDEMMPEARLSGLKNWPRKAFSHALNTRAVSMRHAQALGRPYEDCTFVVAHLGGGISLNIQAKGKMIDTVAAQEGPFSTERAGCLDIFDCASIAEKEGVAALRKYQSGKGGFVSYLNTNDAREVSDRVAQGDPEATLIMKAMALQIAKFIAFLSVDVCGEIDGILLTGGMAHWKELVQEIIQRVSFIAPVTVYPGEAEMEALAQGIGRVIRGEEKAHHYGVEE